MYFWLQISILSLFFLGAFSIVYTSLQLGISPTPSSTPAKQAILRLSAHHCKATGPILELGAGWGTLAFPLAKKHVQHQVIAYEQSLLPWAWMKLRQSLQKQPNLSIVRANFLTTPFPQQHREPALVVCYLFTQGMVRLQTKCTQELASGTPIISNTFSFPRWKPHEQETLDDLYKTTIYVYKNQGNDLQKQL